MTLACGVNMIFPGMFSIAGRRLRGHHWCGRRPHGHFCLATIYDTKYLGAIVVAAYSYMALVPIIQPPVIRMITTKKERMIRMPYEAKEISKHRAHSVPHCGDGDCRPCGARAAWHWWVS